MANERSISLSAEVTKFASTDDEIALGDLAIRKNFARDIVILFAVANGFVLLGLGVIFRVDCVQLSAKQILPAQRLVSSQVIMALLGATTVQLGTVVLTIARAIFPGSSTDRRVPARRDNQPIS